jgi:hypothetical protein
MAALKLMYVLVERVAEPLSARLERHAARNPAFRQMCGSLASFYNSLAVQKNARRRERLDGGPERMTAGGGYKRKPAEPPPPPLSEEEATRLGCDLLGEGFCLGVAIAVVTHQVMEERTADEKQTRSIDRLNSSVAQAVARLDRIELAQRQRQLEPPLLPMVSQDARAIEDAGSSLADQLRAAARARELQSEEARSTPRSTPRAKGEVNPS